MTRFAPYIRLTVWVALAVLLGRYIMADPKVQTVAVPERGLTLTLPDSPEGWRSRPVSGDQLVYASTRFSLAAVEIVDTGYPVNAEIRHYMDVRTRNVRSKADNVVVWKVMARDLLGRQAFPSVKWTSRERLSLLPFKVEYWSLDYYIPQGDTYLRLTLRYPDFLARYYRPDRELIGAGLKLAK